MANKPRVTTVESVVYQPPEGPPVVASTGSSRFLASTEQPYGPRHLEVAEEWKALDHGWIDAASVIVVANAEKVWPGDEDKESPHVLEVAAGDGPPWLVAPGESLRGRPSDLASLRVRSRRGTIKFTVTIFPV